MASVGVAHKVLIAAVGACALVGATAGAVRAEVPVADAVTSGGEIAGQANTQAVTIAPFAGRLALPIKLIASGARVEGEVTRASAAALDLGLLGALGALALTNTPTLDRAGLGFGDVARTFTFPPAARADSRSTPNDERSPVFPRVDAGLLAIGGGHEMATAAEAGEGRGRTEGGTLRLDLGIGVLSASGLVSEAMSSPSASMALTALGELRFDAFGTSSVLRGLEWEVRQELGHPATASFRLGSATLGGRRYDTGSIDQIRAVFDQLNARLAPTGLALLMPEAAVDGTGGRISPLRVAFKDSPAAAQFFGPIYERGLAGIVNDVEAALTENLPETGLAITVANVGLAAATGRGGAFLDVGGADATLVRRATETYEYPPLPGAQQPFDVGGALAVPRPPARVPSAPPTSSPASGALLRPVRQLVSTVLGEGAPAWLVLAGGLGALAALAAVDRRRIAAVLGATPAARSGR